MPDFKKTPDHHIHTNININLELAFNCFEIALDYSQYSHISKPNPHVGCVIWHLSEQKIVSIGRTQNYGQAHAEFVAIEAAQKAGIDLTKCVLFVTLEPCAHQGKTPPCVNKIISSGIQEVCVLLKDPYPKVNGRGMSLLKAQNINAYYLDDLVDGLINQSTHSSINFSAADAHTLASITKNINQYKEKANHLKKQAELQMAGFLKFQNTKKPWVRLKFAVSLDGFMALENGTSQWLTSAAARTHNQLMRARADVVLSTFKTVWMDQARLNVRTPELLEAFHFQQEKYKYTDLAQNLQSEQKLKLTDEVMQKIMDATDFESCSEKANPPSLWVIDRFARLINSEFYQQNSHLPIYDDFKALLAKSKNLAQNELKSRDIFCLSYDAEKNLHKENILNLQQKNHVPTEKIESHLINFNDILNLAAQEGVQEIHIEAGAEFTQYILEENLFDELVIYQAPILLGSGKRAWPTHLKHAQQKNLAQAQQEALILQNIIQLGPDICLTYLKK